MISFIVAMDENRVIGYKNDMPWHLPNDLQRFKKITTGHTIIMGRKTYESIGRPLPNRTNVILSRDKQYKQSGCKVIHSIEDIAPYAESEEEVFVIGGETLFEQTFSLVQKMYITIIHHSFPEGDTFFPSYSEEDWEVVSEEKGKVDAKNKYPHTFYILKRK